MSIYDIGALSSGLFNLSFESSEEIFYFIFEFSVAIDTHRGVATKGWKGCQAEGGLPLSIGAYHNS